MKFNRFYLHLIILTLGSFDASAQLLDFDSLYQNDDAFRRQVQSQSHEDLFRSEEVIKLTIESDFKNIIKRKFKGEYQPATLRYHLNDSVVVTREIKIKPRGNMRRSTCYFPPLMLNFPKKETVMKQIHDFDKMKMVMDCRRGNTYEQYLLSEYYAYKIYNLITEYSFRVRLFKVTLLDTNDKMKTMTSHAYIIESIDLLASRLNAIPIENKNVKDQLVDLTTLSYSYLFQYLIGNTDWSIPARHNIQMIKSTDPAVMTPYILPYDFDYAGIINTNYAVPDEHLGIESVRERVYRGVCLDESHIQQAAKRIMQVKEKIYDQYNSSTLIDRNNVKGTIQYLDEFFNIIEDENSLKRYVLDQCR